jgi:hypothetical protein
MSHTATVSLLKIIFKQLFESSSKLSLAWCTTSYGSSIDTVFDSLIFYWAFSGGRDGVGGQSCGRPQAQTGQSATSSGQASSAMPPGPVPVPPRRMTLPLLARADDLLRAIPPPNALLSSRRAANL